VVITTSDDDQEFPPSVKAAKGPDEELRETEPTIERGPRYNNPDYKPDGKVDSRNNPKTKTDAVIVDPETGKTTPYEKADHGNPPEGTVHHAEQRMENGTEPGEEVKAQAPTKPCCSGCQKVLGDSGDLSKIPTSLQGR
jgi:hypothetical protein